MGIENEIKELREEMAAGPRRLERRAPAVHLLKDGALDQVAMRFVGVAHWSTPSRSAGGVT